MRFVVIATLAVHATVAFSQAAERRPGGYGPSPPKCTERQVKSFLAKASSVDEPQITPFCASYLHYPPQKTSTIKETITDYSYIYKTTSAGTSYYTYTITLTSRKHNAARAEPAPTPMAKRPPESLTADKNGRVLGYSSDVVSPACSCVVTRPIPPATVTQYIVKTVKTTTTVTSYQTTSLIERTTTIAPPPAVCTGADPTFYLKLVDADPSRTDAYNNQYIVHNTTTNDTDRALWYTTPSLAQASLMTLECSTSNLRSIREGRYANTDYFVSLSLVAFDPEVMVARRTFQNLECTPGADRALRCSVRYPTARAVMQTCPLYDEFYDTPVALGDVVYKDGPVCFEKTMVMVPP